MIKILPLNIDPIIKTYTYNAFYIGILEAENIDITNLLLHEFLHIFYYKRDGKGHLDFTGSGFVEPRRFHMIKLEKSNTSYISKIKQEILRNHYLMVSLNEKYITNKQIHCEWDHCHDWLIYGYNDDKKTFLCCGYIGNEYQNHIYNSIEIPYKEIDAAMLNIKNFDRRKSLKLTNHITFINNEWKEKNLSNKQIQKEILSYYYPCKLHYHHRLFINDDFDGMQKFIQMFYKEHVLFCQQNTQEKDWIHLQDFRTIYEHKKVIQIAIKKFTSDEQLLKLQEEVVKAAYTNLLLAFRYNLHPQKKYSLKLYRSLLSVEKQQRTIIQQLFNTALPDFRNKKKFL